MDTFLFWFYLSFFILIVSISFIVILREIQKSRSLEFEMTQLRKKIYQDKGTEKDFYRLANIYIQKKLYTEARQEFLKILNQGCLDKYNLSLIYNSLGYIYMAQEQYDLAIENYKKALLYMPDFISARINLARIFEIKNLKIEAINTYKDLLIFDPKNNIAKKRLQLLQH